ncbi:MAG TPA: hypothetical protein VF881_13685 [Polyangiaceae bacterium]
MAVLPRALEKVHRGMVDGLRLETSELTVAYWSAALLFSLAFWVTPFPPLIDYPQHVAVGALLARMLDPSAPERSLYEVNLITYNGGFHLVLAALSLAMRPETAGRVLLSIYPPALAYAALALVRVADRPRWYAFFVLPITFSFAVGWGFANYFMAVPFVIWAFTLWVRARRGEKNVAWKLMVVSFLLSYTHVLATLCLCVLIGISGLFSFASLGDSWRTRLFGLLKLPLAVWPAVVWSLVVFVRNRYSPHANWEGWDDGLDDPLWYKLLHVTAYAVGNFGDHSDQLVLTLSLALLIGLWQWPRTKTPSEPLMRTLAITWAALYCVVPKVFIATWFIFERFPTFILVFAAAAAPLPAGEFGAERWIRRGVAALALVAGLNTIWHFRTIPDEADADAMLDEIPEGKRVIAVTWSNTGQPVVLREMWVHLLAYYQARRSGQIAYSFAKFESMPVHYALGRVPPVIPGGMEWDGAKYDPTAAYARYWDTVLVRTPDENPADDPRLRTFRAHATKVQLLARHGRFWLFDARGLAALPAPSPRTE